MIAFNIGPGVDVEGDNSTRDQITANRVFDNDTHAGLQFDGSSYVSLPDGLIGGLGAEETIEASFETTGDGIIIGSQSESPGGNNAYITSDLMLYVGTDGKLYGAMATRLCSSRVSLSMTAYGTRSRSWSTGRQGRKVFISMVNWSRPRPATFIITATLLIRSGPATRVAITTITTVTMFITTQRQRPDGLASRGRSAMFRSGAPRRAGEILQESVSVSATEPGLTADYPFDEGRGTTAFDQSPNQNDGTLAGINGDLPTWVIGGEAIDLGNDGVTDNSTYPRQGQQLAKLSCHCHDRRRTLQGWLGGSRPTRPSASTSSPVQTMPRTADARPRLPGLTRGDYQHRGPGDF